MKVPFEQEVASSYEVGREIPRRQMSAWVNKLQERLNGVARPPCPAVLDLGCGTGRFSPLIATTCGARVEAIDPSLEMLKIARERNASNSVTYRQGSAETIPLPSDCCDAAFLFLSLHHFEDLPRAARELSRVCRPGAAILIRTEFSDRPHQAFWHDLLPAAALIDVSLFPKFATLKSAFLAAGLEITEVQSVPYLAAISLRSYLAALHTITISALRLHGRENVIKELSTKSFDARELNAPVFEVGKLVIAKKATA